MKVLLKIGIVLLSICAVGAAIIVAINIMYNKGKKYLNSEDY